MKLRWLCAAAFLCSATRRSRSGSRNRRRRDLVELDVVVVDDDNHPVRGLAQADFEIKEDGSRVDIKTFAAVSALGTMDPDDARSVVLLLDDSSVPMSGTAAMQTIATRMLSPVGRGDDVAVVRLNSTRRRGVRRSESGALSHRRLPRRDGAVQPP